MHAVHSTTIQSDDNPKKKKTTATPACIKGISNDGSWIPKSCIPSLRRTNDPKNGLLVVPRLLVGASKAAAAAAAASSSAAAESLLFFLSQESTVFDFKSTTAW